MATHFTAGMGALWAQIDGPNTQPVYLGCHQLGDIEEPQGDVELIYCPDESGPNRFKVVGSVQGAAGSVTTSITTDVTDDLDELERAKCPFPIYVHMVKSGRKDVFTNFDRTFILSNARITSKGLTALAARTPDDNSRSEQSYDLSGEQLMRFMVLDLATQTVSEVNAINDVTFCNEQACRTDEDVAQEACEVGYAACDPAGGATANILRTTNGATWAATSADPFAADEVPIAIECFELGRDSVRVIVGRGSTVAGEGPTIAYSDDGGATWTEVEFVDTTYDAEFITSRHALFALDRYNIWAGSDQGTLFKSTDAGLTWTVLDAGNVMSAINSIHFVDDEVGWMVGDTNAIARSLDGGSSWSTITGPSAQAAANCNVVFALDRNRAWVGYSDGDLYYTADGGTTWSQRSFSGSGVGEVRDIKFMNEHIGYLIHNGATPANGANYVQYTIDGGYTWTQMTTPDNDGLNVIALCDLWSFYVVGEPVSSLAFIAKASI